MWLDLNEFSLCACKDACFFLPNFVCYIWKVCFELHHIKKRILNFSLYYTGFVSCLSAVYTTLKTVTN